MITNRDECIIGLTNHLLNAMDMNELLGYAYEQLSGYFDKLSNEDLINECDNAEFPIDNYMREV